MQQAAYKTSWLKLFVVFASFLAIVILVTPSLDKMLGNNYGFATREIIVIILVTILNYTWIHQPLHFKSDVSTKNLFAINFLPILFVIFAVAVTFYKNDIINFKNAIIMGLGAGITEELVFRGIILPGAMTHFKGHQGMWYAVIITSVVFGMAHMVNLTKQPLEATILQGVNAVALGLVLAAIYLRTRSLIFPMIIHATNDYISTIAAHGVTVVHNQSFTPFIGQWIFYLLLAIFLLRESKTQDVYKITEKNLF